MATNDKGGVREPNEGDMLPDERAVIAERVDELDELDEDDYLSVEDVADDLGIDLG
ncbi:hypothetical protein [Halobacterium noricense]|uniref:hypothetical protein n=1 Tax=Halobacterium noricense TaxID=223182 RepID=UPI001E5D64B0|nr:hypothetical protein [Halobacterium noricense]UHH27303.1 hypothetical protein LT974_17555 [Halobacterium noricense]